MFTNTIWKIFDKLVVTSRSSSHRSLVETSKITDGIPIWIHGFGRSGTTTAHQRICRALDYNGIFEPLHPNRDSMIPDQSLFEKAADVFRAVPIADRWDSYVHEKWMVGSLRTFGDGWESLPEHELFERFLDALYETYGFRVVVKEIRLFGNLELISHYHAKRSIPFYFLGIIANPVVPLYAYYRRGYLATGYQSWKTNIENLYRYRIDFCRLSGRHGDIARLPAKLPSEKFLIGCLIDNAELLHFIAKDPQHRRHGGLQDIDECVEWFSDRTGTPMTGTESERSVRNIGEGVDRWFYRDIIEKLSPSIRSLLENHWGVISPQADGIQQGSNWKRKAVSLRHNCFNHD